MQQGNNLPTVKVTIVRCGNAIRGCTAAAQLFPGALSRKGILRGTGWTDAAGCSAWGRLLTHLGEEVEAAQAAHHAVHLWEPLPFPFWLQGKGNAESYTWSRAREARQRMLMPALRDIEASQRIQPM